jgi:hypothetical protein
MGVLDFLFEGSAPTPGSTSSSTQIQLPEWYTQYTTDMLGRAQGVANLPYAQYTGPRVAGFTPTELSGFEQTKAAAGAYQPFLNQAGAALGQAGGMSGMGAAAGDFATAAGMQGAKAAAPYLTQAAGMSALSTAQPMFTQALTPIQQAGQASALTAAQPFLGAASRTFPQAAQEYMSPYIQNVVEKMGDIGVRQLQEKYLPAIGQEFIGAGQFSVGPGSTRMGEFGARALRDTQEAILAEQAKALQAGYGQAADIYGQDVGRLAQLAGTVGQLSTADLNRLLESGVRVADIGAKMGQLTSEDAARLADIGRATGQLTQQDAANLARIAESKGQLTQQDAANLQNLASKYSMLGETAQGLGLRGAEAVTGVGAKERAMQQANLDLAYQDFLKQEQYPKEQIKFLADVLQGVRLPQTTIEQTTETPAQPGGASAIEKAITGATGIGELLEKYRKYFPSKSSGTDKTDYSKLADYIDSLRKVGG